MKKVISRCQCLTIKYQNLKDKLNCYSANQVQITGLDPSETLLLENLSLTNSKIPVNKPI